jgi:hypothetical protein
MNSKLSIILVMLMLSACGGENLPSQKTSHAPAPSTAQVSPQTITFSGKRSEFTVKKIVDGFDVSHKNTGISQRVFGTPSLRFSDVNVNLVVAANSTSIAASELMALVELYVAFFNRVPDADGLNYWIDQRKLGSSIDDIANSFYAAAIQYPQLTGYSHSMTNTDFVRIIYKNVLGRETVDQGGLDYWRAIRK